jgi:hypothetical protein
MKENSILIPVIPTGNVELPNDYGAWTQINYQPQIETNQYAWFEEPNTLRCYADKIQLQYSQVYNDFTPIKLRMFYDKVSWADNVIDSDFQSGEYPEYNLNPSLTKTFANNSIVTIEYSSYNHYEWDLDLYDDPMTMFQVTSASLPHTYYGDKDNKVIVMIPSGASITISKADGVYDSTGILKIRISYRTI